MRYNRDRPTISARNERRTEMDWTSYSTGNALGSRDELIVDGVPRHDLAGFGTFLERLSVDDLVARQRAAELAIRAMGITFSVYAEGENVDRAWPFDILPRVVAIEEWERTAAGLDQRLAALNLFLGDVYGDQKILGDGVVPAELVLGSPGFRPECVGVSPPLGVWAHICGSDLVRGAGGDFLVLEDNLRVPSGVSYMIENRHVTKRVFPELFRDLDIHPLDDYCSRLFDLLASLAPRTGERPVMAVLTPGIYNSAYFEHSFLAQQMGVQLVEGPDLVVDADDVVRMRTIDGLQRVDVLYRRVDDLFLDPEVFRRDSVLGTPGLMRAWRAGNVAIANAPGAGVGDDKVLYAYVPQIIEYYLGEEPLIPNVPTMLCSDPVQCQHVLTTLDDLVVKPANESGGAGVFIGPTSTRAQREACRAAVLAAPHRFVAQPVVSLSTTPALCSDGIEPRHVDLRPFVLSGEQRWVTRGGLTRVAREAGSLLVNSSKGGGSKDTWILDPSPPPLA